MSELHPFLKKNPRKSETLRKFKQMAIARSIFTLGGRVQLFLTAFDIPETGVPLKVALGSKKIVFCLFQKNNHGHTLRLHCLIIFLKCPKIKFVPS